MLGGGTARGMCVGRNLSGCLDYRERVIVPAPHAPLLPFECEYLVPSRMLPKLNRWLPGGCPPTITASIPPGPFIGHAWRACAPRQAVLHLTVYDFLLNSVCVATIARKCTGFSLNGARQAADLLHTSCTRTS